MKDLKYNLELALTEALYWRMMWHDSNPDIELGSSLALVFDRLIQESSIEVDDKMKKTVLAEVKHRRGEEHRR